MENFKALDSLNEIVYASDFDTYDLVYANKKAQETFGQITEYNKNLKCYNYLRNLSHPCEFCIKDELLKKGCCSFISNREDLGKHYLIYLNLLTIDNKRYLFEIASDISQMQEHTINLQNSLETERKLEECIKKLVAIGSFDESINFVLEKILSYYDGDRSYIFDFDWTNNVCNNTFEICGENVKSQIQSLQNVPISVVGIWVRLFEDKTIVVLDNIEKLATDDSRKAEYDILDMQGIKGLIAVPISYNGTLQGFLGVDNPKANLSDTLFLENLSFFISNEIQKNELTKSLKFLSYRDMLTGLYNRNSFLDAISSINNESYENKAVIFVDMNGLRYINDTFSHIHGDQKLQELSNILKLHFNEDSIFRINGDEFVILCKNIPYKDFMTKSLSLKNHLQVDKKSLASIGYIWDDNEDDIINLVHQAELLMYMDKQKFYFNNNKYSNSVKPEYLNEMISKLSENEYVVYLQPKFSINTESIYGAEALVRMKDDNGRILPPNEFIPALEKENLIQFVDYYVFESVCKRLVEWENKGFTNISVSCNFSRKTFTENDFVNKIVSICHRTGVNCKQLILEITESSRVVHMEKLSDIMSKLKYYGIRFALDDMGTEYATLEMLELKELDAVKLDRSLIMRLNRGDRPCRLISSIIDMCHKLDMECIAEGVESAEQLKLLNDMGCDKIQGYLIDKPLPIDEFEKKYLR